MADPQDPQRPEAPRLDPDLVRSLFERHADELRRFLIGMLRNTEQADDVLQATFVKALERGHTARTETQKAWLFRVAYHEAIVIKRRQAIHGRATDELIARGPALDITPDLRLADRETIEQVRAALAELPAEQALVVRMRMYDEKKFITIAEELKLPLGTVLTRMQLALKKLRKALKREED